MVGEVIYKTTESQRAASRKYRLLHPDRIKENNKKFSSFRRELFLSEGRCPGCGEPLADGHKRCSSCLSIERERTKKNRHTRINAGLCGACGRPREDLTNTKCDRCLNALIKRHFDNKLLVINHYGKVCQCCGESHIEFLEIDHIDGGGNEHRRSIGSKCGPDFYIWLIKNGYPNGFQVLCANCNRAKYRYGICPHKK